MPSCSNPSADNALHNRSHSPLLGLSQPSPSPSPSYSYSLSQLQSQFQSQSQPQSQSQSQPQFQFVVPQSRVRFSTACFKFFNLYQFCQRTAAFKPDNQLDATFESRSKCQTGSCQSDKSIKPVKDNTLCRNTYRPAYISIHIYICIYLLYMLIYLPTGLPSMSNWLAQASGFKYFAKNTWANRTFMLID